MTIHKTRFFKGTDARNHIVRCDCGWAFSSTYKDVRAHAMLHVADDCEFRWNDPKRKNEKFTAYWRERQWRALS